MKNFIKELKFFFKQLYAGSPLLPPVGNKAYRKSQFIGFMITIPIIAFLYFFVLKRYGLEAFFYGFALFALFVIVTFIWSTWPGKKQ